MGPSGTGKTTLPASAYTGQVMADSGEIEVAGQKCWRYRVLICRCLPARPDGMLFPNRAC